jgi:hypothetical protein
MSLVHRLFWILSCLLILSANFFAQPVSVKYREGTVHGFLSLHSEDGKLLASGDLFQTVAGDRVTSHLVFHFKDGSLDDEEAVFTERGNFRLLTDHHVQSGPSFPKPMDMTIDATSGKVTFHLKEDDKDDKSKDKLETTHLDLQPSLANGILFTVLKNIPPTSNAVKFGFVVATPKPRLVELSITRDGYAKFDIAGAQQRAARFRIKIDLGGVTGAVAHVVGKQPPDINIWILEGKVPAFVRMEGALYEGGPIWTIELTAPAGFKPES